MGERPYKAEQGAISVRVRLTPRGGRDALEGAEVLADGKPVLKARVRAVPENGRANAALEAMLAGALGVPKSRVAVVSGATGRVKIVRILGEAAVLAAALDRVIAE